MSQRIDMFDPVTGREVAPTEVVPVGGGAVAVVGATDVAPAPAPAPGTDLASQLTDIRQTEADLGSAIGGAAARINSRIDGLEQRLAAAGVPAGVDLSGDIAALRGDVATLNTLGTPAGSDQPAGGTGGPVVTS